MKFDQIKELEDKKFRRLTGVKKGTFSKMVDILRQADGLKKSNLHHCLVSKEVYY